MRWKCFIATAIFVSACTKPADDAVPSASSSTATRYFSSISRDILEQVPSELSVEHFANMRLEGKDLKLGSVLADNAAYTRYAITYSSNGLRISGIMNIPKGDGPFPLLILNHGFISSAVYTQGRGLKREQDYLAKQGFTVLHTDYRGHGLSDPSPDTRQIYDAGLEYSMDSANAILAVREAGIPAVDASKVGMLGHSLGGGVTLNIAVARPDLVDAIVLYAPVHSDAWENFLRWRDMREEGDRTRAAMGTRESNPDSWDKLSSLTHLANIDDPVIVFHGTDDGDVPKAWSDFLIGKLQALRKDATYVEYEGEKHEFVPQWDDFMRKTADFFHTRLDADSSQIAADIYDPSRVIKKPFGIFITPENSPVSPEKFRGYHTGTDFESFPEEDSPVVTALCDGDVLYKKRVNGYGGVLIQLCTLDGENVTVLYGHLSLDSISLAVGDVLRKRDMIGKLGRGFSEETDGERAHLHLGIHRGSSIELRGYAQTEAELGEWMDAIGTLVR